MDKTTIIERLIKPDQKIKGSPTMPVLAITADNKIIYTSLPIARRFLMDVVARAAWAIDPRPKIFNGQLTQLITQDSCLPQLPKCDPEFSDKNIEDTRDECYHNAKNSVDEQSNQSRNYRLVKYMIIGAFIMVAGAMVIPTI